MRFRCVRQASRGVHVRKKAWFGGSVTLSRTFLFGLQHGPQLVKAWEHGQQCADTVSALCVPRPISLLTAALSNETTAAAAYPVPLSLLQSIFLPRASHLGHEAGRVWLVATREGAAVVTAGLQGLDSARLHQLQRCT